jgi:lipoyl(octanoyl) transferase
VSGLVFEEPTDGPVDYLTAWEHQREVHARVVAGGPDTVLLIEHPPDYTD